MVDGMGRLILKFALAIPVLMLLMDVAGALA
jgi:hypothetical protein